MSGAVEGSVASGNHAGMPSAASAAVPDGSPAVPDGSPAVPEEVLLAGAYLSRVAEPPAPGLAALAAEVGLVAAAALVRAGRVSEQVAGETGARRAVQRAEADLAAAAAVGARLLTPEHPQWPAWPFAAFALTGRKELAPPVALWVRGPGHLAELAERSVSVVGSRAATRYGMHVAGEVSAGVADRGHTVVSGAAIGIDGAAHRGALAADAPTVAVLACGVDRAYPAAHRALLEQIVGRGLAVSEYPPGCVPGRHRFLVRNRIIAGLTVGTLVVEAGLRSGAQRTAADALALGRVVMAVPGPVTSGLSAGCHRLVRDHGALLVTRTEEVVEAVGRFGVDLAEAPTCAAERPTDALGPTAARVHDALPARAARETRWLALEAGVPIGAVRAALVDLERRGLVEHREGRWQRAPTRRAPAARGVASTAGAADTRGGA